MINKKLISDFVDIIGNLTIAISLETLKKSKINYEIVLNELLEWVDYYYKHKNLNIVTYDNSLRIHNLLIEEENNLLFDSNIGMEAMLSDNILIRYEVIIKTINEERKK
ncbi:MAG: hypothetical protein PUF66_02355 [Clostridium sp.]|jgi:hypothetical protein|nr:hypothetical protein [Clostridium sp.]